jgi:hypothetical protein
MTEVAQAVNDQGQRMAPQNSPLRQHIDAAIIKTTPIALAIRSRTIGIFLISPPVHTMRYFSHFATTRHT